MIKLSNLESSKVSTIISIILLILFISIGYFLWDFIGALLGLAISLVVFTILKNHITLSYKEGNKIESGVYQEKETTTEIDDISEFELDSENIDENKKESETESFEFNIEDEEIAVGLATEDSKGYSIEQGRGGGQLSLKKKNIFAKGPIHARKAIFYDLSIEDIKRSNTREILNFIKKGKETDKKMEFLESIIWELNNLEIYEKFSCLINIAEKIHKKDIISGARYLYRNLETTCKNIDNKLVKSKIYRELAVSFSKIDEIKKAGEYFTKGFKISTEIDRSLEKMYEMSKYAKASKIEEFPKLTNSIVIEIMNYIKDLGKIQEENNSKKIKMKGVLNLLEDLLNADGSKLSEETLIEINSTLYEINIEKKQRAFEKLIILTAKEGYEELYEEIVANVSDEYNIPYEILYEIPYEKLGEKIILEKSLGKSIEFRKIIPYEYVENFNQGLIKGLIKKNELDNAYQYIQEMSLIYHNKLLSKIVNKKVELDEIEQAIDIADKHNLTDTAETLASELIKRGRIQDANELIKRLNFKDRYKIDIAIAVKMAKQGKFIKARHLFEGIEDEILEIEDMKKKIDTYIELAKKWNTALRNNHSMKILKNCIYYAEDLDKISEIFGTIVICGYEKDAFKNSLNIKNEKSKSEILEKMGIEIISSIKEIPKGIINLVQTAESNNESRDYDIEKDRDIFESIAIALVEGEDHIDQMFRIGDIYTEIKKHKSTEKVDDRKKLESIASWAKTKRNEIDD